MDATRAWADHTVPVRTRPRRPNATGYGYDDPLVRIPRVPRERTLPGTGLLLALILTAMIVRGGIAILWDVWRVAGWVTGRS